MYLDHHEYDRRGKKSKTLSLSDLTDIASDYWESVYDGFGALVGTGRKRNNNGTADVNFLDALGNVQMRISDSTNLPDPKHVEFQFAGDFLQFANRPAHMVSSGAAPEDSTRFDRTYGADNNGNQDAEEHVVWKTQPTIPAGVLPNFDVLPQSGHSFQWMTYGVDNKLRYAQKTWYTSDGPQTVFSEYRYDALGRRVLGRTRRHTPCTLSEWKCLSTIDRYVWDGDQLVAEFRDPGSNDQPEENLNASGTFGNFTGMVRYTHAGGIDEPLAVWGGSSAPYGVVPHLSWRGNYEAGSDIQTGALLEGGSTPWIWPTRYKDINLAPEIRSFIPDPTRWLGSLIEGQVDLNGLAYRRNRYYSPTTGRFTQEDPIGLAGGLNLYGFAEGDPVNFGDPFGLCPDPKDPVCRFAIGGGRGPTSSIGTVLAAIGTKVEEYVDSRIAMLRSPDAWADLGYAIIGSIGSSSPSARFIGGARAVSFGQTVGKGTVDLAPTLERIAGGERGSLFHNAQGLLPAQPSGYYSKFVVPTPGVKGAGPMRLILGKQGDQYLTTDHYLSFTRINPPRP